MEEKEYQIENLELTILIPFLDFDSSIKRLRISVEFSTCLFYSLKDKNLIDLSVITDYQYTLKM